MNNIQIFQMEYMYKSVSDLQRELIDLRNEVVKMKCKDNLSQIDISGLKERYNYLEESSVSNIEKISYLEKANIAQQLTIEKQNLNTEKLKKVITLLSTKQATDIYAINKKFDDVLTSFNIQYNELEASYNLQIWACNNAEKFLAST